VDTWVVGVPMFISMNNKYSPPSVHTTWVVGVTMITRLRTFRWVKGHSGNPRNEGADGLANTGALKETHTDIDLEIDPEYKLTGAKIQQMTQALAYKGIREEKMTKKQNKDALDRETTRRAIERAIAVVKGTFGYEPSPEAIWRNPRNKDLSKKLQYFMWMISHDAYRTGDQWLRCEKEDYRMRGFCPIPECTNATSNLDHILTGCTIRNQKIIWEHAKKLWNRTNPPFEWQHPNIGTIIACAQMAPPSNRDMRKKERFRLYRIIVTLSAHLIWKLRWERTFGREEEETEQEITACHYERLRLDIKLTHPKWKNKAIPARRVIVGYGSSERIHQTIAYREGGGTECHIT
jgi:hypothetical protein